MIVLFKNTAMSSISALSSLSTSSSDLLNTTSLTYASGLKRMSNSLLLSDPIALAAASIASTAASTASFEEDAASLVEVLGSVVVVDSSTDDETSSGWVSGVGSLGSFSLGSHSSLAQPPLSASLDASAG